MPTSRTVRYKRIGTETPGNAPPILRRVVPLFEARASDSGNGGLSGYASKFLEIDEYGTIWMPGFFQDSLAEFVERGFTADTHEWTYRDGMIGYPTAAREDNIGLYVDSEFHSTPDAQAIRTKVQERIAAGKKVLLSIGVYVQQSRVILPSQYEAELRKIIPADRLAATLARARQFPSIELMIKGELVEYSVVPVAGLRTAEADAVRSMDNSQEDQEGAQPAPQVQERTDMGATVTLRTICGSKSLALSERDAKWSASEARKALRGEDDAPSAQYKKAHMVCDGPEDEFGSYKLPFARFDDNGDLVAVWKAVTSVAGVLEGARGGADLSDSDDAGARSLCEVYYGKAAKQYGDEGIQVPWAEQRSKGATAIRKAVTRAEYLGDYCEFWMTYAALRELHDCLFYNVIYDIIYDCMDDEEVDLQEINDTIHGACQEYADIATSTILTMMAGTMNQTDPQGAMKTMADQMRGVFAPAGLRNQETDTDSNSGESLGDKPFDKELATLLEGVRSSMERARDIHALRTEKGGHLSAERTAQLAELRDGLGELIERVTPEPEATEPTEDSVVRLRADYLAEALASEELLSAA